MSKLSLTHANIIDLLGIELLPLDQRKEIVAEATGLVETRTLARILDMLNEQDRVSLKTALESEDEEKQNKFFEEHNIDILKITEEEVEKVKHELLQLNKIS